MARLWLLLSACAGFTGVALGAFAAHGLKSQLTPAYLAVFQTGTHYQLIHALALFGVGLLALLRPAPLVNCAGALFALGIVLFSGSLYALTFKHAPTPASIQTLLAILTEQAEAMLAS